VAASIRQFRVTPKNILLDRDDIAYLIDFGIARAADETSLTGGGMIGSRRYMAPERFSARETQHQQQLPLTPVDRAGQPGFGAATLPPAGQPTHRRWFACHCVPPI
jgi:serine/threonine protein kinase